MLFRSLEEIQKMMAELRDCFILDKRSGKALNRYYPRLIRSFDDVWSSKPEARYSSAIARLIWDYLKHIENEETEAKQFRPSEPDGEKASTHKNVAVPLALSSAPLWISFIPLSREY